MEIVLLGLNHHTAPLPVREQLAFTPEVLLEAIRRLGKLPGIAEGLILSTCNRVEVLAVAPDPDLGVRQIKAFLGECHGVSMAGVEPHVYVHTATEAVRHLFRVASSLDSMVVGEPQILGQLKAAYRVAAGQKATGVVLNRLLHKAFAVAKRVRTETRIASSAVSVSFAAIQLARRIFGTLAGKTVLIVGAGEMCELALRHLRSQGVGEVLVTNRTYERAVRLAGEFRGSAIPFEELPQGLRRADIVLTSTGSPNFIVRREQAAEVIRARRHRPMFFIDIAVPRDVDPRINDIENVYLYDLDDLQAVVQDNRQEREKEARRAEEIIAHEAGQFFHWLRSLDVVPLIVALRERAEAIRRRELERALGRMGPLTEAQREVLAALSAGIINKLLHQPITRLKAESGAEQGALYIEAARRLFALDAEEIEQELDEALADLEAPEGGG
ncbi:MAG: glutamyl-tRNA reductase [Deltaproteobacteria bacterium]|nr:glutamyl-tRNA reductase [Deltaproteobacteria bacterium]